MQLALATGPASSRCAIWAPSGNRRARFAGSRTRATVPHTPLRQSARRRPAGTLTVICMVAVGQARPRRQLPAMLAGRSSTIARNLSLRAACPEFSFRHAYELLENKEIVELGVGTGETIVELKYHYFTGKISGYEIDRASYEYAQKVIVNHSVADRYMVINDNFFTAVRNSVIAGCVISNPPYLPARERPAQMPELGGGIDGSRVTKQIVECGSSA